MASFYVASSFDNRPQVAALAAQLRGMGHTISHEWFVFEQAYLHHAARHAALDMQGVITCTDFVGLFDAPLAPLNTYVELGIALGCKKNIYIVGNFDTKCIFSRLPGIMRFNTIDEFLKAAAGRLR